MRKLLLTSMIFFSVVLSLLAQQKTITGVITDKTDGLPIIGATIQVEGTSSGSVTDLDGKYSISAAPGAILVYRFIGMKTQQVTVGADNVINIIMEPDDIGLDEIVVVGYGSAIKRELTGSITKVETRGIAEMPTASFESAIQGKTSGVFIEQASGKLGETVKMRIRGSSSVSANNQPLYVVDGVPITTQSLSNEDNQPTSPLADLAMTDVESIQILKDASAAAIYGSRASNGVVIIQTKRGKSGATKFDVQYTTGISEPSRLMEWLNADQYLELFNESMDNVSDEDGLVWGWLPKDEFWEYFVGSQWDDGNDTDWQAEAFQKGSLNRINLSASGGTGNTTFYSGVSYDDTKGILRGNTMNKLSARLNLDQKATEKFSFGMQMNIIRTEMERVENDNAYATPLQLVAQTPLTTVYDPETGELNTNTIYYNGLISLRDGSNNQTSFRSLVNLNAQYNIFKNLAFRSEFGTDIYDLREKNFFGRETIGAGPAGEAQNRSVRVINYNWENYLTYNKAFGVHNINAVGGMSYQQANSTGSNIYGKGFPTDDFTNIENAAEATDFSSWEDASSFLSYFARANYKANEKYFFTISGRVDGSSRFGVDNRYGFFPAGSAGWIITQEDFMAGIKDVLSYLKLRASYGLTGNSGIPDYAHLALYTGVNYAGRNGLEATQLQSRELGWETTAQMDIGIDFGLFNNRLTAEVDYYRKNTTDLLLYRTLPSTSGFTGVWSNVGELKNNGVEFSLHANILTGALTWTMDYNMAFNENTIISIDGPEITPNGFNYVIEGQPIGVFKIVKYAGVDPDNGDALYYLGPDSNETTNNYNLAEPQIVGSPNPDFTGGFSNYFKYNGFDLNILTSFVYGNMVYNGAGVYQSANADWFDNQTVDQMNRWQNPGDITDVPQARLGDGNGTKASSRYLSDASYFRLRSINLGYNLPASIVSRMKMSSLRVYFGVQNLYTFTNYKGWDPEVNYTGTNRSTQNTNIIQGYDFYTAPQARTYTLGINLSF
ncbi:MAG: TonB-dependent receptor [Bacteroidales bacterium]|jgi:TonB-linked SusC/RagA family outer membrane protein|nr:TonB-dependent receptor [Bacteroidales bacterium]